LKKAPVPGLDRPGVTLAETRLVLRPADQPLSNSINHNRIRSTKIEFDKPKSNSINHYKPQSNSINHNRIR
jgi:hypothetical protein